MNVLYRLLKRGSSVLRTFRRGASVSAPIVFNLDSPASEGSVSEDYLAVNGWVCARAGVASVELFLDDVLLKRLTLETVPIRSIPR